MTRIPLTRIALPSIQSHGQQPPGVSSLSSLARSSACMCLCLQVSMVHIVSKVDGRDKLPEHTVRGARCRLGVRALGQERTALDSATPRAFSASPRAFSASSRAVASIAAFSRAAFKSARSVSTSFDTAAVACDGARANALNRSSRRCSSSRRSPPRFSSCAATSVSLRMVHTAVPSSSAMRRRPA